jgi:SAM-dependent methyltransferase
VVVSGACYEPGKAGLEGVAMMACGSGGVSARIAERTGAAVVGVDINAFAIDAARQRVRPLSSGGRLEFAPVDADKPLPFAARPSMPCSATTP